MSTLGSAGRVGITVVVAVVLLVAMYFFFLGSFNNTYTVDVLYNDATGAAADTPVQLAGVQIGKVTDVKLKGAVADVQLQIDNGVKIPVGSKFRITTPLLGGVGAVAVEPPVGTEGGPGATISAGSVIQGEPNFDLNSSLSQSGVLLRSLTKSADKVGMLVDSLQQVVGDPRLKQSLQESVDNVNVMTSNGVQLTKKLNVMLSEDNTALLAILNDSHASAKISLNNLAESSDQIHQATVEDRARLSEILDNLQDTTAAVAGITTETNKDFANGHVAQNVSDAISNLKSSTDHLNQIAANLQQLTGDPTTDADLKETIHNIRETTAQSAYLLQRLNKLAGSKNVPPVDINDSPTESGSKPASGGTESKPADAGSKAGAESKPASSGTTTAVPHITFLPRADLLQNTKTNHFRLDARTYVGFGGKASPFVDGGVDGLGDNSRLELQYGLGLGHGLDYRAGLYNSKLDMGADYDLAGPASLSINVYDPNHYTVDAQGVLMLNNTLGLVLGADDITRKTGIVAGIELRH